MTSLDARDSARIPNRFDCRQPCSKGVINVSAFIEESANQGEGNRSEKDD